MSIITTGCDHLPEIPGFPRKQKPVRHTVVYVISTDTIKPPPPLPADTSYLESIFSKYDLVDIHELDTTIRVQLRYADTNNILHTDFYDGLRRAYFTCPLAIRVSNAQYLLKQADSSLSLVILDAARPLHIQQIMWDSVNIRPEKKLSYLAHPEATSLHNYGCAVDATLMNTTTGGLLDMGTDFDFFGRVARPDCEKEFLKSGMLSADALHNRRLLRWAMKAAGLKPIASEWWHFGLCQRDEAARRFPLIR